MPVPVVTMTGMPVSALTAVLARHGQVLGVVRRR